jgi:hypothetical protein
MAAKKSSVKRVKRKPPVKRKRKAARKRRVTKTKDAVHEDGVPMILAMPAELEDIPFEEIEWRAPNPGHGVEYSKEVGEQIAFAIAYTLVPIRELCKLANWPCITTLYRWESSIPEFRAMLFDAKRARADAHQDKALADIEAVQPDSEFGAARVNKARALIAVRAMVAKRLSPDWHEKTAHTLSGPPTLNADTPPVDVTVGGVMVRAKEIQTILEELNDGEPDTEEGK